MLKNSLKLENFFQIWTKRSITPLGRVAVLKSLILSKLTFLWLLLPNPPDNFTKDLQKQCYKFVWKDQQDRISRKTVINSIKNGGLGVPDIRVFMTSLKLTWIRKLKYTCHKWKNLILKQYPQVRKIDSFGPEIFLKNEHLNVFWQQVFKAYSCFFYYVKPSEECEILAEPFCYNNNVKVGNSVITAIFFNRF